MVLQSGNSDGVGALVATLNSDGSVYVSGPKSGLFVRLTESEFYNNYRYEDSAAITPLSRNFAFNARSSGPTHRIRVSAHADNSGRADGQCKYIVNGTLINMGYGDPMTGAGELATSGSPRSEIKTFSFSFSTSNATIEYEGILTCTIIRTVFSNPFYGTSYNAETELEVDGEFTVTPTTSTVHSSVGKKTIAINEVYSKTNGTVWFDEEKITEMEVAIMEGAGIAFSEDRHLTVDGEVKPGGMSTVQTAYYPYNYFFEPVSKLMFVKNSQFRGSYNLYSFYVFDYSLMPPAELSNFALSEGSGENFSNPTVLFTGVSPVESQE